MSSPRKYASPYLKGLPGLSTSTNSVGGKTRKKSKNLPSGKQSESTTAVKQVQDGTWQNVKSARVSNEQAPARPEKSFDDASLQEGNVAGDNKNEEETGPEKCSKAVEEIPKPDQADEATTKLEEPVPVEAAEDNNRLVSSKDSILLTQSTLKSSPAADRTRIWKLISSDPPPTEEPPAESSTASSIKSILKTPQDWKTLQNRKSRNGPHGKSSKDYRPGGNGSEPRKRESSLQTSVGPKNNEGNDESSVNKKFSKSPRKKQSNKMKLELVQNPYALKKMVSFSNHVDVHFVPYEPRGEGLQTKNTNILNQSVNN